MIDDPCPHCGHKRTPYLMSTRSDSSLREIWDGEDGPFVATLARLGALAALFFAVVAILCYSSL